ncbi:MAG: metal transporter substrate-binding protein [Rhodospirillales bacterium]|nr:metal transporter substrate-binding protein [Rhodospirillales bacterium]
MSKQGWRAALLTALLLGSLALPAAAEETKLNVGYVPAGDFLPAFVAKDKGFFAKHGLDITLVKILIASNFPAALMSKSIDIGMSTAPGLLQAADSGLDLQLISGMSRLQKEPSFASLVARSAAKVTTAADLRGKKIGVPGFSSMFDYSVRIWLLDHNVKLEEVSIVETVFPQMHDMLANGTVDAVAAIEPFRSRIINDGTGTRVADFLSDVNPDVTGAFWIASGDWIAEHPKLLQPFRDSLSDAIAYIAANPDDSHVVEKAYLGVNSPVLPAYSLAVSTADLEFWETIGKRLGVLQHPVDAAKLLHTQ